MLELFRVFIQIQLWLKSYYYLNNTLYQVLFYVTKLLMTIL